LGIVIVSVFNGSLDSHLAGLHLAPATQQIIDSQRSKLVGIVIPVGVGKQLHAALGRAIDESFLSGFRVVMLIAAALAAASSLSALLLIEGKGLGNRQTVLAREGKPSEIRTQAPSLATKNGSENAGS
jgi:hypothetical protein